MYRLAAEKSSRIPQKIRNPGLSHLLKKRIEGLYYAYPGCSIPERKNRTRRKSAVRKTGKKMVEHIGLEPMTPTLPVWCSSQLS